MDEQQMDAAIAGVVVGLIQARRALDPASFRYLVGSVMVEIDEGLEVALERAHRRKPGRAEGNVVPFPVSPSRPGDPA